MKTKKTNIRKSDKRFVVRRTPGRGLGLFTHVPFHKGDLVIEYTGKKIPTPYANTLSNRYLFEIDSKWTVDGSTRGNIARYLNHSCDGNCETDIIKGKILITAAENIKAGEELTYDYSDEYFDEFLRPVGCRCGAKNCRAPANKMSKKS